MVFSIISSSKDEFNKAIYNVLQRPEYNHSKDNIKNFIDNIKEVIMQRISRMLQNAIPNKESVHSISSNLSIVFMIIGLLIIFGIIVIIVIKVSKVFNKNVKVTEILGEKIDEKTTPASLRQKASSFEIEGQFRDAIRYDFIALLLLMHEKNLIYLDETKTNEEINNYLKYRDFFMVSNFECLMNIFNSCWYGHKMCEIDLYNNWTRCINELWSGVIAYENKNK